MKLLLQTAAWHAHAGCACVHGGSRIDPDVNGHQKAFQRVHDGGAQGPPSSGSWWPLSAPLCLTRAILSISTISKAHRQLVRRSILDADRPIINNTTAVVHKYSCIVRHPSYVVSRAGPLLYQMAWHSQDAARSNRGRWGGMNFPTPRGGRGSWPARRSVRRSEATPSRQAQTGCRRPWSAGWPGGASCGLTGGCRPRREPERSGCSGRHGR